jgi:hypothetical protein
MKVYIFDTKSRWFEHKNYISRPIETPHAASFRRGDVYIKYNGKDNIICRVFTGQSHMPYDAEFGVYNDDHYTNNTDFQSLLKHLHKTNYPLYKQVIEHLNKLGAEIVIEDQESN